jgi:hypothetical protein
MRAMPAGAGGRSAGIERCASGGMFCGVPSVSAGRRTWSASRGPRVDFIAAVHSSRSTLRSVGNSFIHNRATAMVPKPPSATAGTVPNRAAVTPLSN